jgi:GNAT superfamily N-acetyltransferase
MTTPASGISPSIRPASPDDIPVIVQLAQRIWRVHYPGIISPAQIEYMLATMYAPERIAAEMCDAGITWFLAEQEGVAVGFAAVGPTDEDLVAKLHKLYVLPEKQGCGIGRALLKAALAKAGSIGNDCLILAVNKRNTKAIAAYRKWGFRQRDAVTVDIGGGFVMDDFVFEIAIPQGDGR